MTAVLVDSNILIDVLTEDSRWFAWSSEALAKAADSARLVINPIVFAEVSVRFSRIEEMEAVLPKAMFAREALPYEAAFLAGYRLMSRDAVRYMTYFPTVGLIYPAVPI